MVIVVNVNIRVEVRVDIDNDVNDVVEGDIGDNDSNIGQEDMGKDYALKVGGGRQGKEGGMGQEDIVGGCIQIFILKIAKGNSIGVKM